MPIIGASGVVDRIIAVMTADYAASITQVIANVSMTGNLPGNPKIYSKIENASLEESPAAVVYCIGSVIKNEMTNQGDIHWLHTIVVEVHDRMSDNLGTNPETSEELADFVYVYGAAIVRLFGSQAPSLELSGSPYDATTVIGFPEIKYLDRFDEHDGFLSRSVSVTMEVSRREIDA